MTFCASLSSQQVYFPEQENTIIQLFWNQLYSQGGWTLYCGYRFDANRATVNHSPVTLGHVYSLPKIMQFLGCESRLQCQQDNNSRFRDMEEDLHNIYPVVWEIVPHLTNNEFAILEEENWRFDDCDFERQHNLLEPRDIARGNIARAVFYMHQQYGLPINKQLLALLKQWNQSDGPSKQESQRNDKIESIQGRRNPFIDNPALADKIGVN